MNTLYQNNNNKSNKRSDYLNFLIELLKKGLTEEEMLNEVNNWSKYND